MTYTSPQRLPALFQFLFFSDVPCNMSLATRARLFNFLLPGAGMCQLGKWRLAILNILLASMSLVVAFTWGGILIEEMHYVWLVIASGSAGWAHAVVKNLPESSSG